MQMVMLDSGITGLQRELPTLAYFFTRSKHVLPATGPSHLSAQFLPHFAVGGAGKLFIQLLPREGGGRSPPCGKTMRITLSKARIAVHLDIEQPR